LAWVISVRAFPAARSSRSIEISGRNQSVRARDFPCWLQGARRYHVSQTSQALDEAIAVRKMAEAPGTMIWSLNAPAVQNITSLGAPTPEVPKANL
jgi:hypothetical protein